MAPREKLSHHRPNPPRFRQSAAQFLDLLLSGEENQNAAFGQPLVDLHHLPICRGYIVIQFRAFREVDPHGELTRRHVDHGRERRKKAGILEVGDLERGGHDDQFQRRQLLFGGKLRAKRNDAGKQS